MKRAIIYLRVPSESIEDKMTLMNQKMTSSKFCESNNLEVVGIFEDYDAHESFNRLQFKQMIKRLEKKTLSADYLLIPSWSVFTKSAWHAAKMLAKLSAYNLEVKSISEPDDNLFYSQKLAEGPQFNRTMQKIRKLKEGDWFGKIPKGYSTVFDAEGKKILRPNNDGEVLKWVFQTLLIGDDGVHKILPDCKNKGLKCSGFELSKIVRNPFYYGLITIPKYLNEPEIRFMGRHEPLVNEQEFNALQVKLANGKYNTYKNRKKD